MKVELRLFGPWRALGDDGALLLQVADGACIADVRAALAAHAQARGDAASAALLRVSAFASEDTVLRDAEPVPADGRLAVLPPVNGG